MRVVLFCSLFVVASCTPIDFTTESPSNDGKTELPISQNENKEESPLVAPSVIPEMPYFQFQAGRYYVPERDESDHLEMVPQSRLEEMDTIHIEEEQKQEDNKSSDDNSNVIEGTETRVFPGWYEGRPVGPVDIW